MVQGNEAASAAALHAFQEALANAVLASEPESA
jgi:hypothetical protein